MALPNISENSTPDKLFADIIAYVDGAEAMVAARDTMSLVGFDKTVDALCQRILALPMSESKDFEPRLEELMRRISGLLANMQALQDEVADSIKSLNSTKKAASAYGNAPTGKVEE